MSKVYETLLRAEARQAELVAECDLSGEALEEPGEIRWEGAIFERVSSIERQLAALDESVGKRVPEIEQRLLHLLETRLTALDRELQRAATDLAGELAHHGEQRRTTERRILIALAVLGLLVLLAL
jgi:hypothetical protein